VLRDADKVNLCVKLLTKILVHGESVKDEVSSEFTKHFREEVGRNEVEKLLGFRRDITFFLDFNI